MSKNVLFSYHHVDTCTSTNDHIKNIAASHPDQNIVLLSNEQTKGRGQRGKTWESKKNKGWFFSIFIPNLSIKTTQSHFINWQVCLAVSKYLSKIGVTNPLVKWPNDIYTAKGKLAGVLIENQLKGKNINTVTIGVGINIATITAKNALIGTTSLKDEGIDLNDIKQETKMHIQELATKIICSICNPLVNFNVLHAELIKFSFGINRYFNFEIEGKEVKAKITGVDKNGMLNLRINNQDKTFSSGSLKWINEV